MGFRLIVVALPYLEGYYAFGYVISYTESVRFIEKIQETELVWVESSHWWNEGRKSQINGCQLNVSYCVDCILGGR